MTRAAVTAGAGLAVKPMSKATVADHHQLLSAPPEGWCWCVAWEVPSWEGWRERSAEENRRLRETLWREQTHHGYLFYLDAAPIGWCRVGPTRLWPKLCRERGVEASEWLHAFTCFGLRPEHRRRGLLHRFLDLVLADLRRRGVREVVAFPRRVDGRVRDGEVWNGPPGAFRRAGFRPVRSTDRYEEMRLAL